MPAAGMDYDDMEDPNFEHKTVPSPVCEGDVGCEAPIEVIFLRTGAKMCAEHALDQCGFMVAKDREERDTDKAPHDGSPTLPPLSEIRERDDDSPARMPADDVE